MTYLYRGKRCDNEQWVYGWLIISSLVCGSMAVIRVPSDGHESTDVDHRVYWPSVGKLLDMNDSKGTPVYQGDILLVKGNPKHIREEYLNQKYVIEWDDASLRWFAKPLNHVCYSFDLAFVSLYAEVIGSIHDKNHT